MALTASNNESFSNPISNTNKSPVQGNMMASPTSVGGFEVVTPVLSTAEVLIDIDPKLTNETTPEAQTENKVDTAKATPSKKSTEVGMTERAIRMKESAEGGKIEEAITEQAPGTLAKHKAVDVEFNGERYVKESDGTHSGCIIIDGTCYVRECANAPKLHKTAYDLLESGDFAEYEELSPEGFSHARFVFCGQPIMLYIGTHSYSVHIPTLTKSYVLASMPLEEAEDGSYSISLPEEDPIQFENLLTYMYQGTWEPANCKRCRSVAQGQVCGCWTNKKYMQAYAIACKYAVHGLAEKVAAKLDLKENVLRFCEAFETAYETCPGNHNIRSLFRKNLVPVFENTLRTSPEAPQTDW